MRKFIIPFLCLLLTCAGCESNQEKVAPPPVATPTTTKDEPSFKTNDISQEPIDAVLVETPTEALRVWRSFQSAKPTLVLLSKDPFFVTVPSELTTETMHFLQQGSDQDLLDGLIYPQSNPVLMPFMATSAAMKADFFSELVWVFPTSAELKTLDSAQLKQQFTDFGIIDSSEAANLNYKNGVFSGTVRGRPFRAVHSEALPAIQGPVLLHLDLSFFEPYYKGEIKTPIFALLQEKLHGLQATRWKALTVTLSASNLTGEIPLASRFIAPILATLFNEPDKLDQPLPKLWQQQAKALYLPNFIQTEATRDLYLEMESTHPADPALKYGLYQALRETKQPIRAMQALEQAVALDPVYGMEYLQLAPLALEKHRPDEALRMMNLAGAAFPDNPFISLEKVRTWLTMGEHEPAIALLKKLKALTWSEVYYPQMPEQIQAMLEEARQQATRKNPSGEPAS